MSKRPAKTHDKRRGGSLKGTDGGPNALRRSALRAAEVVDTAGACVGVLAAMAVDGGECQRTQCDA
jgi:hypothetical protein